MSTGDYWVEYAPGIGWQAVTPMGRSGAHETEAAALAAARIRAGDEQALRDQIAREHQLQAWRDRGVL